jgi:hypothetical protein
MAISLEGVYCARLNEVFDAVRHRWMNDIEGSVMECIPNDLQSSVIDSLKQKMPDSLTNDFGKLLEDMKIPEKFSNVEKIHSEDLHENESWSINSNNYMDVTDDVAEQYTSDMELLYNQLMIETDRLQKILDEQLLFKSAIEKKIEEELANLEKINN